MTREGNQPGNRPGNQPGNHKKGGDNVATFYDIDSGEVITSEQLFREYLRAHKSGEIDNGLSFAWYMHNCMTYSGGTLRRIHQ